MPLNLSSLLLLDLSVWVRYFTSLKLPITYTFFRLLSLIINKLSAVILMAKTNKLKIR
jgi:hypothetical protein